MMTRQGRHMINCCIKIAKETSNRGVDVIVDFVGKDYFEKNIDTLAIDGRMVILAYLSGMLYPHPHITILTHLISFYRWCCRKGQHCPSLEETSQSMCMTEDNKKA